MTPLKDTLEATTPVAESTSAQSSERSKADSGHLRSDAVSLDVPVKVHGSRVTEVVRGITPHTEPFEEQTSTMIVFPQGGVLRMSTPVSAGQMVVLTNMKTGHDAICRVVKVRAYAQAQSYVELEFTNRQTGYWGVQFLTDDIDPVKPFVPPPPPPLPAVPVDPEATAEKAESKPAPEISWAPAASLQAPLVKSPSAPVERAAQPARPESSFVAIGSQEDVQPAASATGSKKKIQRVAAPAAPLSMAELRGDAHAAPPVTASLGAGVPGEMTNVSEDLAEASQETPPVAFGRLAASASLSSAHTAPQKAFGARFGSSGLGISEQAAEPQLESGQNWLLVAVAVAVLFGAAVGGALYFHVWPAGKAAAKSSAMPAPVSAPAPSAAAPVAGSFAETNSGQNPASNPVAPVNRPPVAADVNGSGVTIRTENATPEKPSRVAAERVQPSAAAIQKTPAHLPDMSAALAAHPVSAQRSNSSDAEPAPSVDAGAGSPSAGLQGIGVASDVAPPPPPAESKPAIKVGGAVAAPKLVSTVLPVYPSIARSTGIEGNVVVDASIGVTGSVVSTKVISGPPMLRQAALDALRRWKYQPATLNGEPVAVDITVTIAFHR